MPASLRPENMIVERTWATARARARARGLGLGLEHDRREDLGYG